MSATCVSAQLLIDESLTPQWLVQGEFLGNEGLSVKNISYVGDAKSIGYFENGDSSKLGLDRGIILSSGAVSGVKGPNNAVGHTTIMGKPGSALLESFIPYKTKDAAMLQFDFKPQTENMVFNYVFASEEYIEWVDSGFNDIFGFFISGPGIVGEQNVALIPGTASEVTIDNVNHLRNTNFFIQNDDTSDLRYQLLQSDGQTIVLKAELKFLIPCEWYTIKLAIADVNDSEKDSWVFVESKSFKHKTNLVNDTFFCDDTFQLVLDAANTEYDLLWSTGDTAHKIIADTFGTYYVDIFTGCGSFRDKVTIDHQYTPVSLGKDTAICGSAINHILDRSKMNVERYLWSNGKTADTYTISDTGWHWLEIEKNGCTTRDSIYVEGKEIPDFELGNDTVFCDVVNHVLNPQQNSDSRIWSTGAITPVITASEPGTYWLTLNLNGCLYSDTIKLELAPEPYVDLAESFYLACGTDSVELYAGNRDVINFDILWSTGSTNPWIQVYDQGIYSVMVTDKICNRTVEDQAEIVRADYGGGYIVSNAFSPNGDNLNDRFKPLGSWVDAIEYQLIVHNRWGEQMFKTNDPQEGWDGTVDNFPVEAGIYIYEIILKTPCAEERILIESGSVHLIR